MGRNIGPGFLLVTGSTATYSKAALLNENRVEKHTEPKTKMDVSSDPPETLWPVPCWLLLFALSARKLLPMPDVLPQTMAADQPRFQDAQQTS